MVIYNLQYRGHRSKKPSSQAKISGGHVLSMRLQLSQDELEFIYSPSTWLSEISGETPVT